MSIKTANGPFAFASGADTPELVIPLALGGVTLTDNPLAVGFIPAHPFGALDLSLARQVRLTSRISTVSASANNPRIKVVYSTSLIAPVAGNYLDLGITEVANSLFTGAIFGDSGWIDIAPLARVGTVAVGLVSIGGDGVADPVFTNAVLMVR